MNEEKLIEESPTTPPAVEPNWREIAFKHEEIGKQVHWLANATERRDKANAEAISASKAIVGYGSKITALQAELIELEANQ